MRARIVQSGETWNNFHTHTFRCHHAEGDVADFARRAGELGMTKLGMSEHAFMRGAEDNPLRMFPQDVTDYLRACREADGIYGGVQVFCGMECDYFPEDEAFYREYYLEELGMDYLAGSVHELKDGSLNCFSKSHFGVRELRIYTDLYVRMIEGGVFTFCAHPDLFGGPIEFGEDPAGWDENAASAAREILEAAEANRSVLEINVNGVWKTKQRGHAHIIYPRWQFWEMASDYDISVIVNTDAHRTENLAANVDYGMNLVKKYGLRRVELG